MASIKEWVEGARPRTLPAAFSPVLAGSALAWSYQKFDLGKALLALAVALALQIGVNFANDYSDGIRGTDAERVGPQRLVGSGAATPRAVLNASILFFGVAGIAGLALSWLTGAWWLLAVGALSIAAAWFYTGGKRPYGYMGLGEVFVFIFFGLVAVGGTAFVQIGFIDTTMIWASAAIGWMAVAILLANNLRDIKGDLAAGKRTLATWLGDELTRAFYILIVGMAAIAIMVVALSLGLGAFLALVFLLVVPWRGIARASTPKEHIRVLARTGMAELVCALGLFAGLALL